MGGRIAACIDLNEVLEYMDGEIAMGLVDDMRDAGVKASLEIVPLGCCIGVGFTRLDIARIKSLACFKL